MMFKRAKEICSTYGVRPAAGLCNRLTLAGFETCPAARYDTSVTLQLKLTRLAAELPLNAYDFCISYIIPSYAL
jgi:hypothetical protein